MDTTEAKQHDFHLVNPSAWPILGALSAFTMFLGVALFLHKHPLGVYLFPTGFLMVLVTMYVWWKDVIKEGIQEKAHTPVVRHGLRLGMALFILSEVMFFFAFFFAFFNSSLFPADIMEGVWPIKAGAWPPAGIKTFDPWHLPFMNTLILLLSGTSVTWAHHALMTNDRKGLIQGLFWTVVLGISFTCLQALEYSHAPFNFKDGIYPSTFFIATGFHGLHVIIGTIFLTICLIRAIKGQLTPEGHLGFEFAAWYWHFVDVVWLFLFCCIYVWGS